MTPTGDSGGSTWKYTYNNRYLCLRIHNVNTLYTKTKKTRIKFTGEKTNNHNPQRPRSYIRDTHIQQLLRSMHYC